MSWCGSRRTSWHLSLFLGTVSAYHIPSVPGTGYVKVTFDVGGQC